MMPDAETPPVDEMPLMMEEGITIGVALGLTGIYAEPYGIPMQNGLELAREELNMIDGVNITFVTEDALSTVEGAKTAVQTLVDQGVPAIVRHWYLNASQRSFSDCKRSRSGRF